METLKPTYKLRIGSAGSSHAFSISERLGMPKDILEKAKDLRSKAQDIDMEKVLTQLNAQAKKMDEEQAELEYRLREARKLEDDLRKEKDKVTSKAAGYHRRQPPRCRRPQAQPPRRSRKDYPRAEGPVQGGDGPGKGQGHRQGPPGYPADFPA
jgi:hypothetical protein